MLNALLARHPNLPAALLAAALACGVLVAERAPARHYSLEARQRAAVAADVIAGASRGSQGLVGSLQLAPLPTVLVILIGLVPFVPVTPALSSVVAAGAAALLAACVNALWRAHGVRAALRYPAVVGAVLLPPVALSVHSGQTAMVFVALAVCGCGALIEWLRTWSLRQLALAAVFLGLAVLARYQGLLLAVGATAVVALGAALRRRGWSYVEGTVLTFALPGLYAALLWAGGNWLILGSPLFFLSSLYGSPAPGAADLRSVLAWDCPWALLGVLAAFACSVPLLGLALGRVRTRLPHNALACGALIALVAVAWFGRMPTGLPAAPSDVRRVVTLLEAEHPNGTFIVTGYSGYEFVDAAGRDPQHRWVHVMHLRPENVDKVLADYRGRQVFLLIHGAEQWDRWDRVGLTWRREGSRIPERFLFMRQVGAWAMFEVLRG